MAQKQADIRYRVQLKQRPHIVIYKVRSGDDSEDYTVTVIHGRVNSCSCISRKPCYHMIGVEAAENARKQPRGTLAQHSTREVKVEHGCIMR